VTSREPCGVSPVRIETRFQRYALLLFEESLNLEEVLQQRHSRTPGVNGRASRKQSASERRREYSFGSFASRPEPFAGGRQKNGKLDRIKRAPISYPSKFCEFAFVYYSLQILLQ
jgi:hypothetical protein